MDIHTTGHYVNIIKDAANPPYEVVQMMREEFLDFKALAKFVTKRPTRLPFSHARQLVVDSGYKEGYILKSDYNLADSDSRQGCFRSRLMKGNAKYADKAFNLSHFPLQPKYPHELLLNPQKIRDLTSLIRFMGSTTSCEWMQTLTDRQRELQNEASVQAEDDIDVGEDSENDLDDYADYSRPGL